MNISYTYDGVDYIESGGTITETHPSLVTLEDEFVLGLSKLRVRFISNTAGYGKIDMVITDGSKKATVENIPFTQIYDYQYHTRYSEVDHTVDTAGLTLETDSGGMAGIEFIFYSGGYGPLMPYTVIADTGIFPADVCEYVMPSLTAFDVYRSDSSGGTTGDDHGAYTITCNASEMQSAKADYPALLKNAVETVITFTRQGTDYVNQIGASGSVLKSGNTPIQLSPEETFTVTATLTDGINTVTMSALLSANFAIFNANAAKTGIAFGKYATQSGFDCNMDAEFRKAVQIDGALTLGTSPFEILWVNPAPTSSISGDKTMSRAPTEGEMLICAYRSINTAGSAYLTQFCWCGVNDMLLHMGLSSNNNNASRILSFTAGSATFNVGTCYYNNNTTRNEYLIPYFIATLKDMKITSAMLSAWVAPT